jgi:hypothetical protein
MQGVIKRKAAIQSQNRRKRELRSPISDDSDVTPKISFVSIMLRTTAKRQGWATQGCRVSR